jgi:hypothetical protein
MSWSIKPESSATNGRALGIGFTQQHAYSAGTGQQPPLASCEALLSWRSQLTPSPLGAPDIGPTPSLSWPVQGLTSTTRAWREAQGLLVASMGICSSGSAAATVGQRARRCSESMHVPALPTAACHQSSARPAVVHALQALCCHPSWQRTSLQRSASVAGVSSTAPAYSCPQMRQMLLRCAARWLCSSAALRPQTRHTTTAAWRPAVMRRPRRAGAASAGACCCAAPRCWAGRRVPRRTCCCSRPLRGPWLCCWMSCSGSASLQVDVRS